MILKNEAECKLPDICSSCKNLSNDELNKVHQEKELEDLRNGLRNDIFNLLDRKNPEDIQREKDRMKEEKQKTIEEIKKNFEKKDKLVDWFTAMVFNYLLSKGLVASDISLFDRGLITEYEEHKEDMKGLSQAQANQIFDSLGKKFIEIITIKNSELGNLIKKASENSASVQKMIGDFDGSVAMLKRVLQIASFPIKIKKEDAEDVKNWIEKGVQSKHKVDIEVIRQSKIEEHKKIILESKRQRFELYGGIFGDTQAEKRAMEKLLDELKDKEKDVFDSILFVLSDPLKSAGIDIVEANLAPTKEIDSLMGKINKKRKGDEPDRQIYDFVDLIRGTLVFKNIDEWKMAANIAILALNDRDMLVGYDPVFLRDKKKEKMLQFNFDIKLDEEVFELQFKTQSSYDVLSIEHNLGYKGGDLSTKEEKALEWFMNQYYNTEGFILPGDESDVATDPHIIEVGYCFFYPFIYK